jgi:hypothetical protein
MARDERWRTMRDVVASGPPLCRIEGVLGHAEACPGARCPFWEPGRLPAGGCAFAKVDIEADTEVAALLVHVRNMLEEVRST